MDRLFTISWSRLWTGLGAKGDGVETMRALLERYSEPWRKYHTLRHLRDCLELFASSAGLAGRPAEVEAALWFHDAVYDPRAPGGDNEEQSARLAEASLREAGVASDTVARVAKLILTTRHVAPPREPDGELTVDIDLAILGAEEPRFSEYERQIREEYAFVPETAFREGRASVLRMFMKRPRIYHTERFFAALERRARLNLTTALEKWEAADAG